MKSRTLVVLLLCLAVPLQVLAAEATAPAATAFAEILEGAYPEGAPGAAAIVVRDGEVLYRGAVGMADLEHEVPLSPEMIFRLGSITKQFTAAAIALAAACRLAGVAAKSAASGAPELWPLMYAPPLLGAALALWALWAGLPRLRKPVPPAPPAPTGEGA